jgi:hypothetical protein
MKKKRAKKGVWVAIVVLVILGAFFLFFNKGNLQKNLDFSSSDCKDMGYFKYIEGVRNVRWVDDSTIEILARVSLNCADSVKSGSYKIRGKRIFLDYSIDSSLFQATCLCNKDLIYRISNIERKDYEIILGGYENFEISCEGLSDGEGVGEFQELQTCCQKLAEDRGLKIPDVDCKWAIDGEGKCEIICEEVDRSYCESDDDCDLIVTDCSGCSCDVISMNKNYAEAYRRSLCKGKEIDKNCLIECLWKSSGCVNNKCVIDK